MMFLLFNLVELEKKLFLPFKTLIVSSQGRVEPDWIWGEKIEVDDRDSVILVGVGFKEVPEGENILCVIQCVSSI